MASDYFTPEDPSGEHGQGLLHRTDKDWSKTRVETGAGFYEDVHHVGRDHVDPCPLGDHHQRSDPSFDF